MKKIPAFLTVLLAAVLVPQVSSLVFAGDAPASWPMPSELPSVPEGVNPAAYAFPKIDWLIRVRDTSQKVKPLASSIELVFDGDSITDGWQWKGKGKDIWDAHYGNLHAFDFGISGDRTEHLLWRLSQGQVDGIHPKLVAIMIGTNNMSANTAGQIADGVKAVVTEYRTRCPEAVILLQAIFPRGKDANDPLRAKIKEVNQIIAKLDDGKQIVFIDFGDKFLSADGTLSPDIMPDYLHPSAKGYQIWADAIQPVIEKCFPKK